MRSAAPGALAIGLLFLPGTAHAGAPGTCQPDPNAPGGLALSVSQATTSATVGTSHTITAGLTSPAQGGVPKQCLSFTATGPSTVWPQHDDTDEAGEVSVTWTSATAGTDVVTATFVDRGGKAITASLRFTWVAKPVPTRTPARTPSPTPSLTPTVPPTTAPPTTTPPATSTPPPGTPTPSLSVSATPTPTATPTATPTLPPATTPSAPVPSAGTPGETVSLDSPSALPGGDAGIAGTDCPPRAEVRFTLDASPAGRTTSGPDGAFDGTVAVPDLPLGRHLLHVTCAERTTSVALDLVVSSGVAASGAGGTAVAVLVFFVLLGGALLHRGGRPRRQEQAP